MTEGKAIRGLPKEEGKAIRGLPKEGGEGLEGPSQGWRGRHQYGLSKDGEHQYGSHGRGRPSGAFPRMEGEAPVWPPQERRGRHQYGLPKDWGEGTSMAFPKDGGHQYGPHERGRPSGAFPRMEGEAPVWRPHGWRVRLQ